MFGLRLTIDSQPRWKNGSAAHSTTGVASASSIQTAARSPSQSRTGRPSIGPMVMTSSGIDSAALTQKRRVKSTSSGFGPSSPVGTPIGSSAMPQIGQEPGLVADDLGMHRAGILRALRHRPVGRPRAFVFRPDRPRISPCSPPSRNKVRPSCSGNAGLARSCMPRRSCRRTRVANEFRAQTGRNGRAAAMFGVASGIGRRHAADWIVMTARANSMNAAVAAVMILISASLPASESR